MNKWIYLNRRVARLCFVFALVTSSLSVDAECQFPREFHGEWMSFDGNEISNIHVGTDRIMTSTESGHVTSLVCKGKHSQRPYYKVLYIQNNGWLVEPCVCVFSVVFCLACTALYWDIFEFCRASSSKIWMILKYLVFYELAPISSRTTLHASQWEHTRHVIHTRVPHRWQS